MIGSQARTLQGLDSTRWIFDNSLPSDQVYGIDMSAFNKWHDMPSGYGKGLADIHEVQRRYNKAATMGIGFGMGKDKLVDYAKLDAQMAQLENVAAMQRLNYSDRQRGVRPDLLIVDDIDDNN